MFSREALTIIPVSRPKNIEKVAKERLLNPLATTREIEEITWIDHSTVSRIDWQLQQTATKDGRILSITDKDLSIVEKGQQEIDRRLSDSQELAKMRTNEISTVLKDSTARYSLFRGNATDEQGGLKNIETIEIL